MGDSRVSAGGGASDGAGVAGTAFLTAEAGPVPPSRLSASPPRPAPPPPCCLTGVAAAGAAVAVGAVVAGAAVGTKPTVASPHPAVAMLLPHPPLVGEAAGTAGAGDRTEVGVGPAAEGVRVAGAVAGAGVAGVRGWRVGAEAGDAGRGLDFPCTAAAQLEVDGRCALASPLPRGASIRLGVPPSPPPPPPPLARGASVRLGVDVSLSRGAAASGVSRVAWCGCLYSSAGPPPPPPPVLRGGGRGEVTRLLLLDTAGLGLMVGAGVSSCSSSPPVCFSHTTSWAPAPPPFLALWW